MALRARASTYWHPSMGPEGLATLIFGPTGQASTNWPYGPRYLLNGPSGPGLPFKWPYGPRILLLALRARHPIYGPKGPSSIYLWALRP